MVLFAKKHKIYFEICRKYYNYHDIKINKIMLIGVSGHIFILVRLTEYDRPFVPSYLWGTITEMSHLSPVCKPGGILLNASEECMFYSNFNNLVFK